MSSYKLDIGCGVHKKIGFIGIDIMPFDQVDYVLDVARGNLPFGDNSIDEVYCNHFLEHLSIEDIAKVMGEIHRVCKQGARVEIRVPHFSGFTNFYEFHKTSFRYNSFREFIDMGGMFKSSIQFKLIHRRINLVNRQNPALQRVTKYFFWNYPLEWFFNKMPMVYELTGLRNLFPAWEIIFILESIKCT